MLYIINSSHFENNLGGGYNFKSHIQNKYTKLKMYDLFTFKSYIICMRKKPNGRLTKNKIFNNII